MGLIPPRRSRPFSTGFSLHYLEPRRFLSATAVAAASSSDDLAAATDAQFVPAAVPITPDELLTRAARQRLLNRWNGVNKASLQAKLDAGRVGAFDAALLEYMRERPGQSFIWMQGDVEEIVDFIEDELSTSSTITAADDLVAHRFPEQGNSSIYEIQLPAGTINWSRQPPDLDNPEFLQSLNRQEFWMHLAQAYLFTRNAKYINELIAQLTSWSEQNPAVADPTTWSPDSKQWNLLDTSVRAQVWVWVHQMVLSRPGWTPAANTLLLAKLAEHGDYLRRVSPYRLNSNRAILHGHGLLQIGQLMPEFAGSSDWIAYGRKLVFGAMDTQIYPDGGHLEQSPNYAANVIHDLLEAYWLDRLKGDERAWSAERVARLHNLFESHVQLLSPDGAMAALSDTYRGTNLHIFTKARLILDSDNWPFARPRMRDAWLFGPDKLEPLLDEPVTPALGDRGDHFAMYDSGYFVARSGSSTNSRQLTLDAGPTGGGHGHFDLLNFELFGYGKPLISDPGLYKYDQSVHRQYVISTRAHNTINVDGDSHAALETPGNPGFVVDQWTTEDDFAQFGAHHFGYSAKEGSPVVARNVWYDYDDIVLVVDWAQASSHHTYQVSYNLPGDASTVSGVQPDGSFFTRYSFGNVKVAPLLRSGQVVARGAPTFVSNNAPPNESEPAYRFTVTAGGTFQVFATLITTYSGRTAPNVTAEWVTTSPEPGQPVVLRLTQGGVSRDITFAAPVLNPPKNLASEGGAANDLAFDNAGNLHLAYFDRVTRSLKYAVRDEGGTWSAVRTIDPAIDAGVYVSLALDSAGAPGVAYYDGNAADLRYAKLDARGAWKVQTVDALGNAGLYPSLVFSRTNDPIISYYNRTRGDLRMATTVPGGWQISTIDAAGDVGRFSSLALDPNFASVNQLSVAYQDTTTGALRYAVQFKDGWKSMTIDPQTVEGGAYVSLAFAPGRVNGAFQPAVAYYDAATSAAKFASFDGAAWATQRVATAGNVGLYSGLVFDAASRASVFFYDRTANRLLRARQASGGGWSLLELGAGGRELSVTRHPSGTLAYTTLDERGPLLEVGLLEG